MGAIELESTWKLTLSPMEVITLHKPISKSLLKG
jgi:hypothetical protein